MNVDEEGRRGNPVPARSLLLKSTKKTIGFTSHPTGRSNFDQSQVSPLTWTAEQLMRNKAVTQAFESQICSQTNGNMCFGGEWSPIQLLTMPKVA
jgi:hypothetical protein